MPKFSNRREPVMMDGMLLYNMTEARAHLTELTRDAQTKGIVNAIRMPGGKHVVMLSLTQYRRLLGEAGYKSEREARPSLAEIIGLETPRNEEQTEAEAPLPEEVTAHSHANYVPPQSQEEFDANLDAQLEAMLNEDDE